MKPRPSTERVSQEPAAGRRLTTGRPGRSALCPSQCVRSSAGVIFRPRSSCSFVTAAAGRKQALSEFRLSPSSALQRCVLAGDRHVEEPRGRVWKEGGARFPAETVQRGHFSIYCPPGNPAPLSNINNSQRERVVREPPAKRTRESKLGACHAACAEAGRMFLGLQQAAGSPRN